MTLQIAQPTRHLPRQLAFHVADKIWFANQMRELEIARQKGQTKEIPLTSRRRRSSIRMGGGFLLTQGSKLIVPQRGLNSPRPGQLCVCGGVYEFIKTAVDAWDAPDNDYVASLFKESQEIAFVCSDVLYIPQLAPYASNEIAFQPPGTLDGYNAVMEKELKNELDKVTTRAFTAERKFWIKVLDYEHAVRLEFAYAPALSVEIAAEIDSSSLECIGVLSYPENLKEAAVAYLEEQLVDLENKEKNTKVKEPTLIDNIKKINSTLDSMRTSPDCELKYWDCELGWDGETKTEPPLHRDIHIIDTKTQEVVVWSSDKKNSDRVFRSSTLGNELSRTRLGPQGTSGRFATEQLQRAIRMHCPNSSLQPLITYY